MVLNKKGFTLIELLAVIVIIGLLTAIAVPSVINISARIRDNMYCTKINILEDNAKMWGQDNIDTIESASNQTKTIKVKELVSGGYVKNDDLENGHVVDPRDNSSLDDIDINVFIKNKRAYATIPSATELCSK